MKHVFFFLSSIFLYAAAHSQKLKQTNNPTAQLDSIERQLQDITKKVTELKKSLTLSEPDGVKKEVVYGYLIIKNEAKNAILHTKPQTDSFKVSQAYKDYIGKKTVKKTDNQTAFLYGQTENQSDKNIKIPEDAKYALVQVDSLFVKLEKNQIVSVVLFSGEYPSSTVMNLSLMDIELGNDYLNFYKKSTLEYIRLRDVLGFIPMYNTDNVKSGIYVLSFVGSAKKIPLQKQ